MVNFIIAFVLIILGVVLYLGKGAFLIAGYNTMSKEKKSEIDEKALGEFIGKAMLLLAFSYVLQGISSITRKPILGTVGWIIFTMTILFIIIYANTKNRFMK